MAEQAGRFHVIPLPRDHQGSLSQISGRGWYFICWFKIPPPYLSGNTSLNLKEEDIWCVLLTHLNISPVSSIYRSRTAFEKNKTDVFRIKTHNVGPLKKLRYCAANKNMQYTDTSHSLRHRLSFMVMCVSRRTSVAYSAGHHGIFILWQKIKPHLLSWIWSNCRKSYITARKHKQFLNT